MEPKDSKFVFSSLRENKSENKGKEEELTPNFNSNKRKRSLFPNGSSSNERSQDLSEFAVGRSKKKIFSCKYCTRTFLSSQALGGHQNAHKEEHALAKAKKKKSLGRFGYGPEGFYPYENMGYFPNQNSMIPSFSPTNFAPHNSLSHFGWIGPMFNPPPPNKIFSEENTEIFYDNAIDEEANVWNSIIGPIFNVGGESNGEEREEESLDLSLKL